MISSRALVRRCQISVALICRVEALYLDALRSLNVVPGKSIYLEKSMKAYSNFGKV